jgi:carbohydrate diacid regulator
MLDHVSREEKQAFLRKLFPGCSTDQIREYILLLDAWFAAEGSLSAIAQTMFIHKNTIQYRLRRLAEITGLDVRKPSQAPALYLAMQVFLELEAAGDGLVI